MKYVAILKDSLYEALDTKVIYVTVGLSCLVILGVASISFNPQPAEKGVRSILSRFPGAQPSFTNPQPPLQYDLEEFQQVNEAAHPWEGEYRFAIVVKEQEEKVFRLIVFAKILRSIQTDDEKLGPEDKEARKRLLAIEEQAGQVPPDQLKQFITDRMKEEIEKLTPSQMEQFVKEQLASYGTLETTAVHFSPTDATPLRFEVESRARAETFRTWPHKLTFLFGAIPTEADTPIGPLVYSVETSVVGSIGAGITMLISAIITAFFIPNMMRKGAVDLLLAKPIHRSVLLVYKFIGGLSFMFVNTLVVVVGVWLVLGLRSGLWSPAFLLTILVLTFEFAIFYSVSTLFAVLTRSPIVAILASCLAWGLFFVVGWTYTFVDATRTLKPYPNWVYYTVDTAHFLLPRYKDLDNANDNFISKDLLGPDSIERKILDKLFASISWGESLGFSTGFIAVMVGLACWRFATKDY
jgi:ABC-type transport system involved in multi-copper enzyme maturation permease subunit